uniref:Uncharacterized protein AlNc14C15G1682 n=1 Tax=Albugo laibachii Nc14 TaxID=890382 RepID=F0W3Y1_9STRA|nr:conserved hypothetical protein [Albugo laibachii Nc14]|eukprot:CCA15776.1 conserved hypothetical protein [Albugo laibachii Nc14]
MTPEEIEGDYKCSLKIEEFRIRKKAEYKIIVQISFFSSRSRGIGSTSWHIWRSFGKFRKLDELLRKRNPSHMKGIQFPPLYRRRSIIRSHLREDFLEMRMRELDTYLRMVLQSPSVIAFHVSLPQSQTLKTFIGFVSGFGMNAEYEPSNVHPSMSKLTSSSLMANMHSASVVADDDDDFRSVASSTYSSNSSSFGNSAVYRWSGTGFQGYGIQSERVSNQRTSSFASSYSHPSSTKSTFGRKNILLLSTNRNSGRMDVYGEAMGETPHESEQQRAKMERELYKVDMVGVGMPPDGSCLLHCIVYEMYPLQCLKDYPTSMTIVNVGAADGMAPRRIAAARYLRVKLMEYALEHLQQLASFLHQKEDELRMRYESFRDTPDEQATTAELYAASSMFNIEIVLISNNESFKIEPVTPVAGLPSSREGTRRTVTFGYMTPSDGLGGHYICTRRRPYKFEETINPYVGGKYCGSIAINPPRKSTISRCVPNKAPSFGHVNQQPV